MLTDGDKLVSFSTFAPLDEIQPTDHVGLYEKYGYDFLNIQTTVNDEQARVYVKKLSAESPEKELL